MLNLKRFAVRGLPMADGRLLARPLRRHRPPPARVLDGLQLRLEGEGEERERGVH